MKDRNCVLIMGAMDCEISYLREQLTVTGEYSAGDYSFLEGTLDGKAAVVCRCLIGSAHSAAAAAIGVLRYDPTSVIICGTAGAHSPELHRGDIVLGQKLINGDRVNAPHRDSGSGSDAAQWQFPEREVFEAGGYEYIYSAFGAAQLLDAAQRVPYEHGRVVCGTVFTSDGWNRELDRIESLHSALGTDCEEMEGFAVSAVCRQFAIPCLDVRIISNNELYPDETCDFKLYGRYCQEFVREVLKRI